jgi:hypothetical protein
VVLPLHFPESVDAVEVPEVEAEAGAAGSRAAAATKVEAEAGAGTVAEVEVKAAASWGAAAADDKEETATEDKQGGGGGIFGRGMFGTRVTAKKAVDTVATAGATAGTTVGAGAGAAPTLAWREVKPGLRVLCIPTHLLCHMDDPVSVVRRYVQRHARPGDMVSLGETPLAVMQVNPKP